MLTRRWRKPHTWWNIFYGWSISAVNSLDSCLFCILTLDVKLTFFLPIFFSYWSAFGDKASGFILTFVSMLFFKVVAACFYLLWVKISWCLAAMVSLGVDSDEEKAKAPLGDIIFGGLTFWFSLFFLEVYDCVSRLLSTVFNLLWEDCNFLGSVACICPKPVFLISKLVSCLLNWLVVSLYCNLEVILGV